MEEALRELLTSGSGVELQARINDFLTTDRNPDSIHWQELLVFLCALLPRNPERIAPVLLALPEDKTREIFAKLIDLARESSASTALIQALAELPGSPPLSPESGRNLAHQLIVSPLPLGEHLATLTEAFSCQELAEEVFEMHRLADVYSGMEGPTATTFQGLQSGYQEKKTALLETLVYLTAESPQTWDTLIADKPVLASWIMTRRLLHANGSAGALGKLTGLVLQKPGHYNWRDTAFFEEFSRALASVFRENPREAPALFSQFDTWHKLSTRAESVWLCDLLLTSGVDTDTLTACIRQADDAEGTLTSLYLGIGKNHAVKAACISQAGFNTLVSLCPHIMAIASAEHSPSASSSSSSAQITNLGDIFRTTVFARLAHEKDKQDACHKLALALALLPPDMQHKLIGEGFILFQKDIRTQITWMRCLLDAQHRAPILLPYCLEFLKKRLKATLLAEIWRKMPDDLLLALFLAIQVNGKNPEYKLLLDLLQKPDFTCPDKLVTLLATTPDSTPETLTALTSTLDGPHFITLLLRVVDRARENTVWTACLDTLFLSLCSRLENMDSGIQGWEDAERIPYMAAYMLSQKNCVKKLGINPYYILDMRRAFWKPLIFCQLLEKLPLDEATCKQVAMAWLLEFQSDNEPATLQTIIMNLVAHLQGKTDAAHQTLKHIFRSAWSLLAPDSPWDEAACQQLLTTELVRTGTFDALNKAQATLHLAASNPGLGAKYVARIADNQALISLGADSLISILRESPDRDLDTNWEKIRNAVERVPDTSFRAMMLRKLIQTAMSSSSPLFCRQVIRYFTEMEHFKDTLPMLDAQEIEWIVSRSDIDHLDKHLNSWLLWLHQGKKLDAALAARIVARLPGTDRILHTVCTALRENRVMPEVFAILAISEERTPHLEAISATMATRGMQDLEIFLRGMLEHARDLHIHPVNLPLITRLVSQGTDHATNLTDKQAILTGYLNLCTAHIQQRQEPARVLRLVRELLASLEHGNSNLLLQILGGEPFASLLVESLTPLPDNPAIHPLLDILLATPDAFPNPCVWNSAVWQELAFRLLAAPPRSFSHEQYISWFQQLTTERQHGLATRILETPGKGEFPWAFLQTLASALPASQLLALFHSHPEKALFAELIFRHPQGFSGIDHEALFPLMASFTASGQVSRILESHNRPAHKQAFVAVLFDWLRHTNTPFSSWMQSLGLDEKTLLSVCNYTVQQRDKTALAAYWNESPWMRSCIRQSLCTPIPYLHKGSLLEDYVREALSMPGKGTVAHPDLLASLPRDGWLDILKKSLRTQERLLEFASLILPFDQHAETLEQTRHCAHWLQVLPLLATGVMDAWDLIRQNPAWQDSALWREFFSASAPASSTSSSASSSSGGKRTWARIPELVRSFTQSHADETRSVARALDQFTEQQDVYSHCSDSRLSAIQPLPESKPLTKLEKRVLTEASRYHAHFLQDRELAPEKRMPSLLESCTKLSPATLPDTESSWLLNECLFSPACETLEETTMQHLVNRMSPAVIQEFARKSASDTQLIQNTSDTLLSLRKHTPAALLTYFARTPAQTLKKLQRGLQILHLPNLSHLAALAEHCRTLHIREESLAFLLPDPATGNGLETIWFQNEFDRLEHRNIFCQQRRSHLLTLALQYTGMDSPPTRLQTLEQVHRKLSPELLVSCLNSWIPFLEASPDNASRFLQCMEHILTHQPGLSGNLTPQLQLRLLPIALGNTERHEALLHILVHGAKAKTVRPYLDEQWMALLPEGAGSGGFDTLSAEVLASVPDTNLAGLLRLRRLSLRCTPAPGLLAWQASGESFPDKETRDTFAIDTSLYAELRQALRRIDQTTHPEASCKLQRLVVEFRLYLTSNEPEYYRSMDTFAAQKPVQEPEVWLAWLLFKHFLTPENADVLRTGLLVWLELAPANSLTDDAPLTRLLEEVLENTEAADICETLGKQSWFTPAKQAWFYQHLLRCKPMNAELAGQITKNCSFSWIAEQCNNPENPHRIALLRAALTQPAHRDTIQNQIPFFLGFLSISAFSFREILGLLDTTPDPGLRSLLACHMLQREDYQEFLRTLKDPETRNRALVQCLDPGHLPPGELARFQPAAALALLRSVRHFHRLNTKAIGALLTACGKERADALQFWLQQAYAMPNYANILTNLLNMCGHEFSAAFTKLEDSIRQAIRKTAVLHSQDIGPEPMAYLGSQCDVDTLCVALTAGLIPNPGITAFLDAALQTAPTFPDRVLRLMPSLLNIPEHGSLHPLIQHHLNTGLRLLAERGDTSLFYERGGLRHDYMLSPVQTADNANPPASGSSALTYLGNAVTHLVSGLIPGMAQTEIPPVPQPDPTDSTLIWFLRHFQTDNTQPLQDLLHRFCAVFRAREGEPPPDIQPVRALCELLADERMQQPVRNTLFATMSAHPDLAADPQILDRLLHHDSETTLRRLAPHWGNTLLQTRCNEALGRIANHDIIRANLEMARNEARIEEEVSGMSGWFLSLRRWFKRIREHDWHGASGFFNPVSACRYATPFGQIRTIPEPVVLGPIPSTTHPQAPAVRPLVQVLDALAPGMPTPEDTLNAFQQALYAFECGPKPEDQHAVRARVDALYQRLVQDAQQNHRITTWLSANSQPFIDNRIALAGLFLAGPQPGNLANARNLLNHRGGNAATQSILASLEDCQIPATSQTTPQRYPAGKRRSIFRNPEKTSLEGASSSYATSP